MAWCDRQLQGYANAVQNDREELEDPKTQWVRTQARYSRHKHATVCECMQMQAVVGQHVG